MSLPFLSISRWASILSLLLGLIFSCNYDNGKKGHNSLLSFSSSTCSLYFSVTVHDTNSVFQSEPDLSCIPGICRYSPLCHLSKCVCVATDSLFITLKLEFTKFSIPFSIKKARAGRRKIWKTLASLGSSVTYYRQIKATSGEEEGQWAIQFFLTGMHHHLSQNPVSGTGQRKRKGNCQVLRIPILWNYMSDSNFFFWCSWWTMTKFYMKAYLLSKRERCLKI